MLIECISKYEYPLLASSPFSSPPSLLILPFFSSWGYKLPELGRRNNLKNLSIYNKNRAVLNLGCRAALEVWHLLISLCLSLTGAPISEQWARARMSHVEGWYLGTKGKVSAEWHTRLWALTLSRFTLERWSQSPVITSVWVCGLTVLCPCIVYSLCCVGVNCDLSVNC